MRPGAEIEPVTTRELDHGLRQKRLPALLLACLLATLRRPVWDRERHRFAGPDLPIMKFAPPSSMWFPSWYHAVASRPSLPGSRWPLRGRWAHEQIEEDHHRSPGDRHHDPVPRAGRLHL